MSKHLRWPMCLTVRKKPLIKCAVSSLVFILAYAAFMKMRISVWLWADAMFLSALLMLLIGCWTLVRWLGLFDLTAYSWKRFVRGLLHKADEEVQEETMPGYVDYLNQPHKLPSAGEPLLCAAVWFALYLLLVYGFGL